MHTLAIQLIEDQRDYWLQLSQLGPSPSARAKADALTQALAVLLAIPPPQPPPPDPRQKFLDTPPAQT